MIEWPEALRRYAVAPDKLRLPSTAAHPFVWFAFPFGLTLMVAGIGGIAEVEYGLSYAIVGLLALGLGVWPLASVAYSAWGQLEIERTSIAWLVTRRLGRWSSTTKLAPSAIRFSEIYSPPPFVVVFPGSAGRYVRVALHRQERPFAIGAGLSLDPPTLEALCGLFKP